MAAPELNLAWFIGTPFGKPFDPLDPESYAMVLSLAEAELSQVKCNCPSIYAYAVAIKISLMIPALGLTADGSVDPGAANKTGHVAYVIEDEVYDTKRRYQLKEISPEIAKSSPAGILSGIMARCGKAPLAIGAMLVRSFPGAAACGCGGSFESRFGEHADKADN